MYRFIAAAAILLAVIALSACGGSNSSDAGAKAGSDKPAAASRDVKGDITLWVGFTQRELRVIKRVVKGFESKHPGLHVKVVGGINDDKIVAAIRGGHAADAVQSFTSDSTGAFCSTGAWDDLTP